MSFPVLNHHASVGLLLLDSEKQCVFSDPRACQLLADYGLGEDADLAGRLLAASEQGYLVAGVGEERRRLDVCSGGLEVRGGSCTYVLLSEKPALHSGVEQVLVQCRALQAAPFAVIITDTDGVIEWANPAFEEMTGYKPGDFLGRRASILKSGRHPECFYQDIFKTLLEGRVWKGELINRRKDGSLFDEEMIAIPIPGPDGVIRQFIAMKQDISHRSRLVREKEQLQVQLSHTNKMEAIGQLAAGIAHEINSPTQFVNDNLHFLKKSCSAILAILDGLDEHMREHGPLSGVITEQWTRLDYPFTREEVPQAILEAIDGIARIAGIVKAMKEFSHPGMHSKSKADLNHAIQNTVTVSKNEWKYAAEMKLDLAERLPLVDCNLGEINQVLLNLIVNAAHTIQDRIKAEEWKEKGAITITTRHLAEAGEVEITIADTGMGIPESIRDRILEPFFTTKDVGQGTGQGLSIAYHIICEKHRGRLSFDTEVGQGTAFHIHLPLS
ncbi:MAG: PAS domain-containing protein [Puniceicoccaceae bacterium]|nr:MAG: PAS domain-containing protein [Puniceicoccaceae bacterium]